MAKKRHAKTKQQAPPREPPAPEEEPPAPPNGKASPPPPPIEAELEVPAPVQPKLPVVVRPPHPSPSPTRAALGASSPLDRAKSSTSSFSPSPLGVSPSSLPPTYTPPPSTTSQKDHLQLSAVLIALSSFLWGYGISVLNVCLVPDAVGSLLIDINLSTEEQETATALVLVGALVAAIAAGSVGQRLGLRIAVLLNNALFILGGLLCALAMSKTTLFAGRFCIGLACGIVTNTVPILLNEIAPVARRGEITSYHQLLLTIGILTTGVLGAMVIKEVPSGWRYLNAGIVMPAAIQLIMAVWVPESPWWLMKHKGKQQSRAMLLRLRGPSDRDAVEAELVTMAAAQATEYGTRSSTGYAELWKHRPVVLMGMILVFFQAMTGINTVMLYSAKIFHFAGVTNPFLATAVVGIVNVLVTILSVSLVDSYGRRPLLLVGTALMIVALLILSLSLLYLNHALKWQGVLAVGAILLFVSGFAVGLGAIVWCVRVYTLYNRVVLADITPVAIRSRAFSIFMGISYLANILIAVYTLSAINFLGTGPNPEKDGIAKLYLILCGVSTASWLYTYVCVPETREPPAKSRFLDDDDQSTALLLTEDDEEDYDRGITTEL